MQICRSSTKNYTESEWKFVKITKSKKSYIFLDFKMRQKFDF